MSFESRYKKLNDSQREAVDTIDGPVMVVAGPGTGKTELLGMRVANILKKTDALPQNILCLTFTEAGSIAMQKRLINIIGRTAYSVPIHTFHAFGTEIMSRHREYFYSGADFRPADELARHRILTEILDSLDYDNPLRRRMNDKYTTIGDISSAISDLKRAGLTSSEFESLLDAAEATIDAANTELTIVFTDRIVKASRDTFAVALEHIEALVETTPLATVASLRDVLVSSMQHTLTEADSHEKTTPPLTAWKREWMTTDEHKQPVLKAKRALPKLRALCHIYDLYLEIMQKAELIDFDDMIMQVIQAIESHDDLRAELQETYQYIMVDEFQDTNLAQMRILHNLIDSPVADDTPNILVVGDDDQAIYGFQGADVGNILYFRHTYPRTKLITLTQNYRSVQPILTGARQVIIQGQERLENHIVELSKELTANHTHEHTLEITAHTTPHLEREWIATSIRQLLDTGTSAQEIAVIARKHADLVPLLEYLTRQNIPVSYDRQSNILDDELIQLLEQCGNIVHSLSVDKLDEANVLLPRLMAHPAWGIEPTTLWDISLAARDQKKLWLEIMRTHDATKDLFTWLITLSAQVLHLPLERALDILVGHQPLEGYTSPIKAHFFPDISQTTDLTHYTTHLENLSTLRQRLRDHVVDTTQPKLADFLEFIAANQAADTRITSYRHIGDDSESVRLISAHSSKGLEFDHVFIVNATDAMWGEKARGRTSEISYPPHLRLRQNSNTYDERLRLFYVAMTRARQGLHISYAQENDTAKEMLPAAMLIGSTLPARTVDANTSPQTKAAAAEKLWYAPIAAVPPVTKREYLEPLLRTYKLSATHVNNFIDITHGGPQRFLIDTLLRFPSAPAAANSYGIAIHAALQRAHDHIRATKSPLPEEDILHEFERHLGRLPFSDDERRSYTQKGSDALRAFLREKADTITANQQAELNFFSQDVVLDNARLTGKLDVVQFNKDARTAIVTDYKTGGALTAWDKGQDWQRVKAHKYRQQLLFYKLLIENSRDWKQYTMDEGILQFVEPTNAGAIVDIRLGVVEPEELERFTRLVGAIWQRIMDLDFPDTSSYSSDYKGLLAFEDYLLTAE